MVQNQNQDAGSDFLQILGLIYLIKIIRQRRRRRRMAREATADQYGQTSQ